MSVFHTVSPSQRLVVSNFQGRITLEEIAVACTNLRHNPAFRPTFRQLADLSQVSQIALRREDLTAISTTYDPFSKRSKRAFVAADDATRETVGAYQSISGNPDFRIYNSILDAIASLDLAFTILQASSMRPSTQKRTSGQESITFDLQPNTPPTFRPLRRRSKKARGKGA
jgi:hypothetical protein